MSFPVYGNVKIEKYVTSVLRPKKIKFIEGEKSVKRMVQVNVLIFFMKSEK